MSSSHKGEGWSGWKAVAGCNHYALALYRITLGLLLTSELVLRFRFLHPFYCDEGTLPMRLLEPETDSLYKAICVHCLSGSLTFQAILLALQVLLAVCLTLGYRTKLASIGSWFLYLSLTLRNTWLSFILDRYFHYLLWYAIFLPLNQHRWSVDSFLARRTHTPQTGQFCNFATFCLKLQVVWIYADAGWGKYTDPLGGWTYGAQPLPALDTYARHTVGARYMYALLGPPGLRLLTPTVVWVEMMAAPLALTASYFGKPKLARLMVGLICSLHLGIAVTLRNTVLLSLVACCAWCAYLPPSSTDSSFNKNTTASSSLRKYSPKLSWPVKLVMISFVAGSVWFEVWSEECNQSMKHIWSTVLHNRWNVFVGAEEYVTWEIAPGKLEDGSVVDVWGRTLTVDWNMPGTGTPCTSTARPGRWRSYPYLAELDGEEGFVLWNYLCHEWNTQQNVAHYPGRRLKYFNFFMLQADVLPNMGFSSTRKRLIQAHVCSYENDNTTSIIASILNDDSPEEQENVRNDEEARTKDETEL
mmetsp:Transcript_3247/g.5909  ORF Transcript_3247/g.5909 Transcript_3247/m.5909 type:complete len:529 (-) Transcript_3247:1099-2685(-)